MISPTVVHLLKTPQSDEDPLAPTFAHVNL